MTMNCRRTKEYLWGFSRNLVPFNLRFEIDHHLQSCVECRSSLDSIHLVDTVFECFGEIPPSSYFDQRLKARLGDLQRQER